MIYLVVHILIGALVGWYFFKDYEKITVADICVWCLLLIMWPVLVFLVIPLISFLEWSEDKVIWRQKK